MVNLLGGISAMSIVSLFSSDGEYLASGSDDKTTMIWDMNQREVKIGPPRRHTGMVGAVSFSPDEVDIVSGSENKNIFVWYVNSEGVLHEINCVNEVSSVTYSPDGLFILA